MIIIEKSLQIMTQHSKSIYPVQLGYRMPAEWEKHAATQLHWPSNRDTWPGSHLKKVEAVFLDIIDVLHNYEPVVLLVDLKTDLKLVEEKLVKRGICLSEVALQQVSLNDVWARDCGPIFIKRVKVGREEFALTDWEYNAWGEKYPPYDSDNRLPRWVSEKFGIKRFGTGLVLEGGSIDTNGEGVFLTTEAVLLNPNRNPGFTRTDAEQMLERYLGASQVIWLRNGLVGDDTDGHIDDLSRFLNRDTILTMVTDDKDSVNYETLRENLDILNSVKDRSGKPFTIVTLPLPDTTAKVPTVDGSVHVPASYANFYIANGVVLVPLYDRRYDAEALKLFETFFPDRAVHGIPCSDLVWGQGSIHCITQQLYGADFLKPR